MRRKRSVGIAQSLGVAAVCALLLTVPIPAGWAASGCPKTSLNDLEDEVMCPVCGTSLAVATGAPQAQRERTFIQSQIAQCKSKSQVKQALVAQFGPEILAIPKKSGFDLTAWLVPVAAVLLAALAIGVALVRWRRQATTGAPEHALAANDNLLIDEELKRLDP